jgi:response regulator RpfG family c-di-GMP phosphodiesterase
MHVIVCDQNLPDGNGVDFLAELPGTGVDAVPILITGYADLNVALDAINRGKVYKFVDKPLDLALLKQIVRRAAEHRTVQEEKKQLASEVLHYNQLLRHESEIQRDSLRSAQSKIRDRGRTVRKQKKQIETLYDEIQSAYLQTVTSLCAAIEAKDHYTRGHSDRVYYYCTLVGRRLQLKESSFEALALASVLHDIGKIGIPDSILLKSSSLTESEFAVIRTHPELAEDILVPLPFLETTRRVIRHHHERYDGEGYPDGLKENQISIEARILAVADAYDAMRSSRPYRSPLSREASLAQLESEAGRQFCPVCVSALRMGILEEGECPPTAPSPINRTRQLPMRLAASASLSAGYQQQQAY